MKREGRQHGMVRTHCILPRDANSLVNGAPPTAGIFTRVPSKPTNHSKFTGKCRRPRCSSCHLHPSSKSKDKTKGSSKLRSSDADLGCAGPSLKLDGYSSSKLLDELHDYTGGEEEEVQCDDNGCDLDDERPSRSNWSTGHRSEMKDDENEDDDIGFYDVAISWEPLEEEGGWFLVGEM